MIETNADYALLLESLLVYSKAKTIVEIGVAFGYTTSLLCRGAKATGGHVYGFDIWQTHGLDKQFDQLCSKEEVQKRLSAEHNNFTLTQIDSQTPQFRNELRRLCPQINLAFIDGCHSYVGVKNDFDAVYPLLANGGIIAFHDTLRIDGCREFMLDLRTKYNDGTYDVFDLPWGIWPSGIKDGLSFLMKRDFQNHDEILEVCGSPSTPQEIYRREREWYRNQLRNPSAVAAQTSVVPSTGLVRQLKMLQWRLSQKWAGLQRRLARLSH